MMKYLIFLKGHKHEKILKVKQLAQNMKDKEIKELYKGSYRRM